MTLPDDAAVYIGLMSGTSLDGVDAVAVRWAGPAGTAMQVLAHAHEPLPAPLAQALLSLNTPGPNEIDRAAQATHGLAETSARAVRGVLTQAGLSAPGVRALGVHGQTVRHRPEQGWTVQLDTSPWLAEWLGIDTVSDFRSQDVTAGGQGAPLVPAFHAACFGRRGEPVAVLNLGGIANLSLLDGAGGVRGFDTGPANLLLDACLQQATGNRYDRDGARAAAGRVDGARLEAWIQGEPFFAQAAPKSTGRDLFSPAWLAQRLAGWTAPLEDRLATLAELTARTVVEALHREAGGAWRAATLWVCGGGARNRHVLARLAARHAGPVRPTDEAGLPAEQVEACAFAWLARERLAGRPTTVPAVTGAASARSTGAVRQARPSG